MVVEQRAPPHYRGGHAVASYQLSRTRFTLYTILQILSVTLFEKVSLPQLLASFKPGNGDIDMSNQLLLFEL
jgi:hypothetical protein